MALCHAWSNDNQFLMAPKKKFFRTIKVPAAWARASCFLFPPNSSKIILCFFFLAVLTGGAGLVAGPTLISFRYFERCAQTKVTFGSRRNAEQSWRIEWMGPWFRARLYPRRCMSAPLMCVVTGSSLCPLGSYCYFLSAYRCRETCSSSSRLFNNFPFPPGSLFGNAIFPFPVPVFF